NLDGRPPSDLLEQSVERRVHRVGEHVGAGHEADAEHDRQRCQQQPELVGENALERGPPHSYDPPSDFIRSSTRSAVGAVISSTTRPSPRNTTRSANPAAV